MKNKVNSTVLKFDFPRSLLKEYDNWLILLRPDQVTLGALIIAHKEDLDSFSKINPSSYLELKDVFFDVERLLKNTFKYKKINYLALMMIDKYVHFHVIPRYDKKIKFNSFIFEDKSWPGPPDLSFKNNINDKTFIDLVNTLKLKIK